MALDWKRPTIIRNYESDVIIRCTKEGQKKRAFFSFSRKKIDELGWERIAVAFDGKNRIYFKADNHGYKLTFASRNNKNGKARPQIFIPDKKLASICELKHGGYTLKYDPAEKCRCIDLLENNND